MKKRRNNSDRASTLQIALSTGLISISAILLAIAAPTITKKAPRQDPHRSQLKVGADIDSIRVLGSYPDTSILLSTDTTVTPDAAPTNTTSINVSTSTNFKGTLEGDPATGVVRVTDAHPAGTYTITVRAFNGLDPIAMTTFTLTVTSQATCTPINFGGAVNFGEGTNPRSVAVGDFNGDGKQDLALANYGSDNVSILLGDGTGNFGATTNFATGIKPNSVAVGDFNGDGKQDLVTANDNSESVSILLGDGGGHFALPITLSASGFSSSVAVGDFNGDGKQDLAVANYSSNTVSILLGNGTGHFGTAVNFVSGITPRSVAVGDFNGDGRQDLVTANVDSRNVSILLGDGTGGFSSPMNFETDGAVQVAVGDFNGDGKQDLAVVNHNSDAGILIGNVSILLGDGAGHFGTATIFATGGVPSSLATGDFDGDSKQDLAVANSDSNNVSLLLGDGAGHFGAARTFVAGSGPSSVAVGDFNRDGNQDFAVANFYTNYISILSGDGSGNFTSTDLIVGDNPSSVAVGDLNNDGKQDLAVANFNSNNVAILLGDGAGNFVTSHFDAGIHPFSVAVGDFNGDGDQDLVVANIYSNHVSILLGDGAGHFSAPSSFGTGPDPFSVAVGDFNGDGKQDLAVANENFTYIGSVSILLGDGAGHFGAARNFATGNTPRSVAVGDFNSDGKQDLAVANYYSNYMSIFLGDGTGSFATRTLNLGPHDYPTSVSVGDFNGDGKQDLAVANQGLSVLILLGEGTGCFDVATRFLSGGLDPDSIAVGDFNGDGAQDLAVAILNSRNVAIALGDGAGHFGACNFGAGANPLSVAVGDFNGDGKQDLAVANDSSNNVSILLRDCAPISTPTPTPATARQLNFSTRVNVQTGDSVGIGGFIITGCAPKEVGVRGIGPSLACCGVPNPLADPVLELHGPPGFSPIVNDNWRDSQPEACMESMLPHPTNDLEAELCATLEPGAYTVILRDKNNGTGVGLVEVYDLGQEVESKLANISTRGLVGSGDDVVIGGFIFGGNNDNSDIVIYGLGPSLADSGVSGVLADPTLELRDSNGTLLSSNDNCTGFNFPPPNPLEACIVTSLPPDSYTAILAGKDGDTGIGLVAIYDFN